MIEVSSIQAIIEEQISGTDIYIVEISVSKSNQINVFIDSPDGVDINACIGISKFIESSLDREIEDFELNVSSAGIDRPLKVLKQYEKNIGNDVQIDTTNGERLKAILSTVTDSGISIEWEENVKVEGKKKKQTIVKKRALNFNEIKETKIVFSFK